MQKKISYKYLIFINIFYNYIYNNEQFLQKVINIKYIYIILYIKRMNKENMSKFKKKMKKINLYQMV